MTIWQITVDKATVWRNDPKITIQLPSGNLTIMKEEAISLYHALKIILELS